MNAVLQLKNPTRLELSCYAMLDHLGFPYLRQHVVNGKFTVDAYLTDSQVVVQFDGDYWHGNPSRFPNPDKRQLKRMRLDVSQDAYMRKCGMVVVRFWESELKADPARIERLIRTAVDSRLPAPPA